MKTLSVKDVTNQELTPKLIMAGAWYVMKNQYGIESDICAGAAMLFQDLRQTTKDLDLQVREEDISKLPLSFECREITLPDTPYRYLAKALFPTPFVYIGSVVVPFPAFDLSIEVPVDVFNSTMTCIPNDKYADIQKPTSIQLMKNILGRESELLLTERINKVNIDNPGEDKFLHHYAVNSFNQHVERYIALTKE